MSFQSRIATLFLAVIVIGVALASVVIYQGASIRSELIRHIETSNPLPHLLSEFQHNIIAYERLLYNCYLNNDPSSIIIEMAPLQDKIQAQHENLKHYPDNQENSIKIATQLEQVFALGIQLGESMQSDGTEQESQFILTQVTKINENINNMVLSSIALSRDAEKDQISIFLEVIKKLPFWLLSFVLVLAGVMIFIIWYLKRHFKLVGISKNLHAFPEKNPNPVLALTLPGDPIYCNPATITLSNELFGHNSDELRILPADFSSRIVTLVRSGSDHEKWFYNVKNRNLEIRVHILKNENRVHLYVEDITERVQAKERLDYLAHHDMATGVFNRYQLIKDLDELVINDNSYLGMLQIEGSSRIAAIEGQKVVDSLFEIMATRITGCIATAKMEPAQVYRVHDSVFCILVQNINTSNINQVFKTIVHSLNGTIVFTDKEYQLSSRAGLTKIVKNEGLDQLTSYCETALQHKPVLGDSVVIYNNPMTQSLLQRQSLERGILPAIEQGQFFMVYQPQIDLASNSLVGVEALIRWQHPDHGWISPLDFIDIAESSGLIVPLGEWILNTTCNFWAKLQATGRVPNAVLAVNLSPRQFQHRGFLSSVRKAIEVSGIKTENLELEITESLLMENLDQVSLVMDEIKDMGIALAIDDFGTGYSSLSYLNQFPVDKLKIDRSFINKIPGTEQNEGLVQAIINMGHAMELKVIAEGAEEADQVKWLHTNQCDEIQGYFFSKPLEEEQLYSFIDNGVIKSWE